MYIISNLLSGIIGAFLINYINKKYKIWKYQENLIDQLEYFNNLFQGETGFPAGIVPKGAWIVDKSYINTIKYFNLTSSEQSIILSYFSFIENLKYEYVKRKLTIWSVYEIKHENSEFSMYTNLNSKIELIIEKLKRQQLNNFFIKKLIADK